MMSANITVARVVRASGAVASPEVAEAPTAITRGGYAERGGPDKKFGAAIGSAAHRPSMARNAARRGCLHAMQARSFRRQPDRGAAARNVHLRAHLDSCPHLSEATMTEPILDYLTRLRARFAPLREGAVATYIPELSTANPDWFGICLATTDGRVYEIGDTRQAFTIQSISKAFVYGLALEDHGRDAVMAKIGVEPTGDAFNSISLEPTTGRPLNPMINAGAIAAASLVAGRSNEDRFHRVLSTLSLYAGRPLELDLAVYESERDTGHRNRAIAHMLRNFDIISEEPTGPLDVYFRQCSIAVDCHALAVMGATLANGGVNPLTGERAIREACVPDVLSVMTTCGMYDYAGEWVYWVGMPAKSGVGGGILAVLPGQLAIAVFSPPLDARGNSVRGVAVCKELSRELNLHFLRTPRASRSAIRAAYDLAVVRSKRVRTERERDVLRDGGSRARVYELHGDLVFVTVEPVLARINAASAEVDHTV